MHKIVKKLFKKQKGQAMIEYGLIVSLIAVAVIAAILLLGGKDGGGTCEKKPNASACGFSDYTYNKQGDTGIYSLYRSVTCQLGGWSEDVVFKDEYNSFEEAEEAGFVFSEKSSWNTGISDYTGSLKNIMLPNFIKVPWGGNKEVNQIKPRAFINKGLTSVILPDALNAIQESTFENNKLKSIEIPSKVKVINNSAFKNNQLTQVNFSEGANLQIHEHAFQKNNIESLIIPSNVTQIRSKAFDDNGLKEITIKPRVGGLNFKVDNKAPANNLWEAGTYKLEKVNNVDTLVKK